MIFICCFPHRFITFFCLFDFNEIELVSECNRFIWNSFCRDRECTHVFNKSLFCCTTFTLLVSLLIFLLMLLIVMMMIIIGWYFGAVYVLYVNDRLLQYITTYKKRIYNNNVNYNNDQYV